MTNNINIPAGFCVSYTELLDKKCYHGKVCGFKVVLYTRQVGLKRYHINMTYYLGKIFIYPELPGDINNATNEYVKIMKLHLKFECISKFKKGKAL